MLLFVIVVYSYERAVFVVYATLVYLPQLMGSQGGGGRGDSDLCTSVTVLLTSVYIRSAGGGGGGGGRGTRGIWRESP